MIRAFRETDMEAVLEVWLSASIEAHHFVAPAFWRSQVDSMRTTYLPRSEVWVYEADETVVGFFALLGDRLAAIFVSPDFQGSGIGSALLAHAKRLRSDLSLTVYQANAASVAFYRSQGFAVVEESLDSTTGQAELVMSWAR